MAESRFERYVRDTLADAVKERRDELKAAVEEAKVDLDAKAKAFQEIADEACAEADKKIRALAKKWGWTPVPGTEKDKIVIPCSMKSDLSNAFTELRTEYSCYGGRYEDRHVGGPVAAAQKALAEFDDAVEKAARRLVVCKMDLHMKPDAFDKMMAEAIAKLLK